MLILIYLNRVIYCVMLIAFAVLIEIGTILAHWIESLWYVN